MCWPSGETASIDPGRSTSSESLSTIVCQLGVGSAAGRSQAVAAAASESTVTPPSSRVARLLRCAAATPRVREVARVGLPSAAANSVALAKRSAGSFSSARSTAASTCSGTALRWGPSGRGSSVINRATIACTLGPVNGASPTSIS